MQVSLTRFCKVFTVGTVTATAATLPAVWPAAQSQQPPHPQEIHHAPSTWEVGALYMCC